MYDLHTLSQHPHILTHNFAINKKKVEVLMTGDREDWGPIPSWLRIFDLPVITCYFSISACDTASRIAYAVPR